MIGHDGEIGRIRDAYFDGATWNLAYFVVATGPWLNGRRVLLSPVALKWPAPGREFLRMDLSQEQIAAAPVIDLAKPPNLDERRALASHYRWPEPDDRELVSDSTNDPGLTSLQRFSGYRVEARDGKLGTVGDFILDDRRWSVRYLVVHKDREGRRPVWVAPNWIAARKRERRTIELTLPVDSLRERATATPWGVSV